MGAVYEGIDQRFGTPVALKEILIQSNNSADEQQKRLKKAFEREAKALANARHEAVPYVRDYFSELDRQFLVMEMVEGDELGDLLRKRKSPFPLEDALTWLDQLLDALDYLHTLTPPIFHRDIKPQNLKLNPRKKIKLLDFGIAKSADATSGTNHTFVGATPEYSPIEQILRAITPTFREFIILEYKEKAVKILNQSTDARCDIYALGATFYHLLTNHLPADVVKRTVKIWSGGTDILINPANLNSKIPLPIAGCLLKAMEVERDERFSSAQEMREALLAAISEDKKNKAAEEKRKRQEQLLAQTKTDPLVICEEIKPEIKPKTPYETNRLSPIPLHKPHSDIQNPASEYFVTESSLPTLPDVNLTKEVPAKLFWIVPLFALSILAAGGMVWLNGSNSANTNKTATNVATTPIPDSSSFATPTIAPSIGNTVQTNIETNGLPASENIQSIEQSEATPQTPVKSARRSASAKKRIAKSTPRRIESPSPKPSATVGPCIYTNDCE